MRKYSMAYLTANGASPVAAVEAAAEAGYDLISFRLLPAGPGDAPPPLLDEDVLLRETMSAMKDTGILMADAEMIRLGPETDLQALTPFLDRIAELGAKHILTAIDDPDRGRAIDAYGALCRLVEPYGFSADLEFMPWTECKTVRDALEFVNTVDHPAAAVLFDALHFDRCGSTLEDLDLIPRDKMNYIQLCDGPAEHDGSDEGMMYLARNARLMPGRGGVDIAGIMSRMPEEITVSVEVPDRSLAAEMGLTAFAHTALEETRAFCEEREAT